MLNQRMQEAINNQIRREFESAQIYLSMAAYFEHVDLAGFAQWMRIQFQEEQAHAFKFFDFVNDRGGRVILQPLGRPPIEFQSPLDAFEQTLAHEQKITGHINDLYGLAMDERDYPSQIFLQWFVEEQVEEEKTAGDIMAMLKMVGENNHALIMLDRELGQRQPPAQAGTEQV